MKKGSGVDAIAINTRYPREIYQKLVESKEKTKSRSINKRLIAILDEYFQMKEAEEVQKKDVS
jgi:hypothetical protein